MVSVFVVDDEPSLHYIYRRVLQRADYEVTGEAMDGSEALEQIQNMDEIPDVVIMDHRMPIMDGLEAMQKLLERYPELTVIMVSADLTVKRDALNAGAKTFVEKPFRMGQLVECLNTVCAS